MFIAADESGAAPKYLVIGTVWLPNDKVSELERQVTDFRVREHFWREMHLDNLTLGSNGFNEKNYLALLQLAWGIGAEFKCIVMERAKSDMVKYHDDNERIRQLNFLAVLLRNKLRIDCPDVSEEINIVSDNFMEPGTEISRKEVSIEQKDGVYEIKQEEIRKKAIPHAKERIVAAIGRPISCMAQCSSHMSSAIQFADLFAGSVAARLAGVSSNDPRIPIIEEFEKHFHHPLGQRTAPLRKDLNIWIWRPAVRHFSEI